MGRGARAIAVGVWTIVALVALALPASAEGPGYGGDAGELSVRVLGASETRPEATAPATGSVLVAARGFLAGSTAEVRVGDDPPVSVPADDRGRLAATIAVVGPTSPATWVSVSGTDPAFQRKVVAAPLPADGTAGPSMGALLLAAAAAALAGSAALGLRRSRQPKAAGA